MTHPDNNHDPTPRREQPPKPNADAAARQRARERAGEEALPLKSGAPKRDTSK